MPLSTDSALTLACGVCDDPRTGLAGLGVVARLQRCAEVAGAEFLGLRRRGMPQRVGRPGSRACGLRAGPPSRRLGPLVARECAQRWGFVPVRGDGPASTVEGQLCAQTERGYNSEKQSWLPAVHGGAVGVSARLHAGGPDGQGREHLDRAAVPWRAAQ